MKLCQGPRCHTHKTKDRIRGPKGYKQYELVRDHHSIMAMETFVINDVCMNGLICTSNEH